MTEYEEARRAATAWSLQMFLGKMPSKEMVELAMEMQDARKKEEEE